MGGNFPIKAGSKPEDYEHIQAISVGFGTTYGLILNPKDVESCPKKEAIFSVIRTWKNARAADAFPGWVKKEQRNPAQSFYLEELNKDQWNLYGVNKDGTGKRLFVALLSNKHN